MRYKPAPYGNPWHARTEVTPAEVHNERMAELRQLLVFGGNEVEKTLKAYIKTVPETDEVAIYVWRRTDDNGSREALGLTGRWTEVMDGAEAPCFVCMPRMVWDAIAEAAEKAWLTPFDLCYRTIDDLPEGVWGLHNPATGEVKLNTDVDTGEADHADQ